MNKKLIAVVVAVALVLVCAVGGTVAWITTKTEAVKNTFTIGDIDITLTETTGQEYNVMPGATVEKDPVVTVKAGSEDCWLFVKVEEGGTKGLLSYSIDLEKWATLDTTDYPGVFYTDVVASDADQAFNVLTNNQVTIADTITKDNIPADAAAPTLTFTAYAVQKEGFADPTAAWEQAVK